MSSFDTHANSADIITAAEEVERSPIINNAALRAVVNFGSTGGFDEIFAAAFTDDARIDLRNIALYRVALQP